MAALPEKAACKLTVDILALAHDRGCEAELATLITGILATGALPDMAALRQRFAPDPATLPNITVLITPLKAGWVKTESEIAASRKGSNAFSDVLGSMKTHPA